MASGVRRSLRAGRAFIRLREDLGQVGEGLPSGLALSARPPSIPIAGSVYSRTRISLQVKKTLVSQR